VLVGGKEKKLRFRTKTLRSRDITLEEGLLLKLKAWREKNPTTRFIFGTASDLPNAPLYADTALLPSMNTPLLLPAADVARAVARADLAARGEATDPTFGCQAGVGGRSEAQTTNLSLSLIRLKIPQQL
jgi:hypothetical protein